MVGTEILTFGIFDCFIFKSFQPYMQILEMKRSKAVFPSSPCWFVFFLGGGGGRGLVLIC